MVTEYKRIGDIASTASGGTPSRDKPTYYTGEICWVTTGELKDGPLFDTKEHITMDAIANSSAKIFPSGTLLMAMYGATIGKLGIIQMDAATNQACCAFFPKNELSTRFLYYWLLYRRKNIIELGCGAGQPNISQDVIRNIMVPSIKIVEQEKIASILSDVDELISNLERLIDKKINIKQGVMQELLTRNRRLTGFVDRWESYSIKELGDFYNGLSGKTRDDFGHGNAHYIPFMNVLYNTSIDIKDLETVDVGPRENQNLVKKYDLFFNTSSETPEEVGMCSVLLDDIPNTYLNSFCFGYRLKSDKAFPLFLSYYFNSFVGRKLMTVLAQGLTRYNLSKSNFEKLIIELPPFEEQVEIASILSDMDLEIETLSHKLDKYKNLKQGAMQKLLTGEIRLI